MRITVIGAGIGGFSAAICLPKKGHSVTVLEGQLGLAEFGAGLQMSPNTIRASIGWVSPSLCNRWPLHQMKHGSEGIVQDRSWVSSNRILIIRRHMASSQYETV